MLALRIDRFETMRVLFSFPDRQRVVLVAGKLLAARIPCEVRGMPPEGQAANFPSYPEVWIRNDADYHAASLVLCRSLATLAS
jgi:hypothetical protein